MNNFGVFDFVHVKMYKTLYNCAVNSINQSIVYFIIYLPIVNIKYIILNHDYRRDALCATQGENKPHPKLYLYNLIQFGIYIKYYIILYIFRYCCYKSLQIMFQ